MAILIKEDPSCYASARQQQVLGILSGTEIITNNFFLTGGTALSVFYLHHRSSEDIDLFSLEFNRLNEVDILLKRIFNQDAVLVQSSPDFFSYLINDVKVDFIHDHLSIKEERPSVRIESGEKICVDTIENISSNKLAAIASRYEPKDLVDFYFISKGLWKGSRDENFNACYEMARQKEVLLDDPAMTAYQIEELLNMVISEKENILPLMKKNIDWALFEKELRYYINRVYAMEKW